MPDEAKQHDNQKEQLTKELSTTNKMYDVCSFFSGYIVPDIQQHSKTNKLKGNNTMSDEAQHDIQKEKLIKELSITNEIYDIAANEATTIVQDIQQLYIKRRTNELKVQETAKVADEERVQFEKQQLTETKDKQISNQVKKLKRTKLIYRILSIKLFVLLILSIAISTKWFSTFELYEDTINQILSALT